MSAVTRCCSICGVEEEHFLFNEGELVCFDCFESPRSGKLSPARIINGFLDELESLENDFPEADHIRFPKSSNSLTAEEVICS